MRAEAFRRIHAGCCRLFVHHRIGESRVGRGPLSLLMCCSREDHQSTIPHMTSEFLGIGSRRSVFRCGHFTRILRRRYAAEDLPEVAPRIRRDENYHATVLACRIRRCIPTHEALGTRTRRACKRNQ